MKTLKICFIFLFALSAFLTNSLACECGFAQNLDFKSSEVKDKTPQEIYLEKYSAMAITEMKRTGVPASITLAQGLLESGNGKSRLAIEGNNHFGIKCHNWTGEKMYHDDDAKGECFRKYKSAAESFKDHSDFLRYKERYKFLFDLDITDYKSWAYGLKKAGYATDPAYPQKLIKIIEDYSLYEFDVLDNSKKENVIPESPRQIETPEPYKETKKSQAVFAFSLTRQLYSLNGVPFVYSLEGESYESIAKQYNLFIKEILRFNDLDKSEPLAPGTIVYLQKKKRSAAKHLDKHFYQEGETLWGISQRYAIRLNRLKKLNGIKKDSKLIDGDVLNLRK